MSNAEIAQRLYLAESTIKTHVKAILGKTGCANRVELIVHAFATGLVPLPSRR
nr:LuxR C-terminal-related transcriptional regulator [Actinomyces bowdenii]